MYSIAGADIQKVLKLEFTTPPMLPHATLVQHL